MGQLRRFLARLADTVAGRRADDEAAREIAAHTALVEDDYQARGMTAEDARRRARLDVGGPAQLRETHRDARLLTWADDLARDVRYAWRSLARTPGFTAVALLTLALGIGANTAIFSVVEAVILHPLPFAEGDRLVEIRENVPASETANHQARRLTGLEVRELLALKGRATTLSDVIASSFALVSVAGGASPTEEEISFVSANTASMLHVQPVAGRWFTADEEQPGKDRVIVLSDAAWRRYFNADPEAVGKPIAFNGNTFSLGVALGESYTVIGVMPRGFRFPDDQAEMWAPYALVPAPDGRPRRTGMMARLAPGASLEAAAAEAATIVKDVRGGSWGQPAAVSGPGAPGVAGPSAPRIEFVRVQDGIGTSVKSSLLVLTGAVGFVLLIACANVANLMLARTAAREREIAVRIAIGAGRARLVRQFLTESMLLSLAGGGAGVLLARGGVALFRQLASVIRRIDLGSLGNSFPRLDAISVNPTTLLYAAVTSIATGIFFGLIPALRQVRRFHPDALRGAPGSSSASSGGNRITVQSVLVVAEVAMAMTLLVGGGLLVRSFTKLVHVDPGYDPAHVLTLQVGRPGAQLPPTALKAFAEELADRLRAVPSVQAAGYANQLPLVALENSLGIRTTPALPPPGPPASGADVRLISRGYLEAMGIRTIAGRTFGARDTGSAQRALIINRTLARREFAGLDPVGQIVYIGRETAPSEIIGVVEDVHQAGLDREPRSQMFINIPQWSSNSVPLFPVGAYYALRVAGDTGAAMANVRDVVRQLDARASIENVATMDAIVANSVRQPRMYAVLLGVFAGIAVLLAAAGIYGVMAYRVTERTREIGIRMALGAERGQVLGLVLKQSALLTGAGIALGLAGAAATTRYLESLLFGLTPLDPATFAAVALLFASVATLASYIPARRATKVDPLIALRAE